MYFDHAHPLGVASCSSKVRFNCPDKVHYYPGAFRQMPVRTAITEVGSCRGRADAQSASPIIKASATFSRSISFSRERTDPASNALATYRYRLIRHDLRSHYQAIALGGLNGDTEIRRFSDIGG